MQNMLSSVATNEWLRAVGGLLALTMLAWAANVLTRRVFLALVHRVASRTRSTARHSETTRRKGLAAAGSFSSALISARIMSRYTKNPLMGLFGASGWRSPPLLRFFFPIELGLHPCSAS